MNALAAPKTRMPSDIDVTAHLLTKGPAFGEDRRLMAWEQLESVWPIHGSTLVRNDEVWFVAGRSAFLDGGLQMYRLKTESGEVISHATLDGKTDDGRVLTGAEEKRLVGLPDVLSASGDCIFMRAGVFNLDGDKIVRKLLPGSKVTRYSRGPKPAERIAGEAVPHLFSSYGFLDGSLFPPILLGVQRRNSDVNR